MLLNVVLVLGKKSELNSLTTKVSKMSMFDKINGFTSVDDAIDYISKNKINLVITDFKMENEDGDEISILLHDVSPDTDLIYLADDESYAYEAWKSFANGFVVKPVKADDITQQLLKIYKTVLNQHERLMCRCFGNFECFHKGQPITFERKQAKEFLAYLIDRKGAEVSENEIRAILWEDAEDTIARKSYLRTLASIIRKTFESIGQNNVFNNNHGSYSINMDLIDCDYYSYLNGEEKFGTFRGEYMMQYSWAEETLAALEFDFFEE